MARRHPREPVDRTETLSRLAHACPACGRQTYLAYHNSRRLITLDRTVRYILKIRRCRQADCSLLRKPLRPRAEGALALPRFEYGFDILALIGALRYSEHQTVPEIHQALLDRHVEISERNVTPLLHRYEELLALRLGDAARLLTSSSASGARRARYRRAATRCRS